MFDTYFSFINEQNEFARNILPYSILPLNDKDCIGLMSGHIRAKSYLDLSYFESRLKERGWHVERIKLDSLGETVTEREMFKKDFSDVLFKIKKKLDGGLYSTTISRTEILHMMSSFYSTDFILDAVEYRYDSAQLRSKGSQRISPQFPNEKVVLN
jgi:hypothetical protein